MKTGPGARGGEGDIGGVVVERVRCTPYGVARHGLAGDVTGDGAVFFNDAVVLMGWLGQSMTDPASSYNPDADLDADGDVDFADLNAAHYGWTSSFVWDMATEMDAYEGVVLASEVALVFTANARAVTGAYLGSFAFQIAFTLHLDARSYQELRRSLRDAMREAKHRQRRSFLLHNKLRRPCDAIIDRLILELMKPPCCD